MDDRNKHGFSVEKFDPVRSLAIDHPDSRTNNNNNFGV